MTEFKEFPKIARWSREVIITEKIDGTNASIFIGPDGEFLTGSRSRWITPADDNFGFSKWAHERKDELLGLGAGMHFGEWWGAGIQRRYGLTEKRFSLFNVSRWYDTHQDGNYVSELPALDAAPDCCHVVPTLYRGPNVPGLMETHIQMLAQFGSQAALGFMDPEGVVMYHVAGGVGFKKTIKKDEAPKGMQP